MREREREREREAKCRLLTKNVSSGEVKSTEGK